MSEDYYPQEGGIRQPDPTLGKNLDRQYQPPQVPVLGEPAEQEHEQDRKDEDGHEEHSKPRRTKVVLADPKQRQKALRPRVELEQQTTWGVSLVEDLVKSQLRTSLTVATVVLVLLGSLPVAFFLSPTLANLTVIGVPVPWLLLGVLPFPLLFGAGLWYNRQAERHERDFVHMIDN